MADLREALRDELNNLLVDAHGVPDEERDEWARRLTRAARQALAAEPTESLDAAWWETMRQVHARHDLGHKLGAWPHACALCEASQALRSEQEKT